ncbi:GMC oxidoreductase [Annulohypoxylon bovei var. microspora]|nr:GMC oxidoreductase [Annulohypoxylon bovei var. microspora]
MLRSIVLPLLALAWRPDYAAAQSTEYEYVVVMELAKSGHSVLLLEAGADLSDDPLYQDTSRAPEASNDPRSRWDFFVKHSDDPERELKYERMTWRTTNGSFYVGLDPPEGAEQLGIYYPRAATLGGCAMHNAAVLYLPSDEDWDYIADITGDNSWRASEMRKIFEEIENCHYLENGTAGHGFSGWLDSNQGNDLWLSNATDGTALLKAIAEASGSVGNSTGSAISDAELRTLLNRDINGLDPNRDQLTGIFGMATHTDAARRRFSPANYIKKALKENPELPLTVQLNSFLTGITWDQLQDFEPPAVMSVDYVVGPSAYRADPRYDGNRNTTTGFSWVSKELIIAGGTFNSPQILKLGGIGPADELEKHNITVVADLPGVGTNLGDNYEGGVLSLAAKPFQGLNGPYVVQLKTSASKGNRDIYAWPLNSGFDGFWPGWPDNFGPKVLTTPFVHMESNRGSGSVILRSADPFEPPEINFRFFEGDSEKNLQAMLEAVKFGHKLKSLLPESSGLAPFEEMHPCRGEGSGCTDEGIKEYLKLQAYSHHASGTCAIGNVSDPMSVLDSKFRVKGVKGLRVVDASVFPKPPGAFPVLPTFMISKKAAKDILEDA